MEYKILLKANFKQHKSSFIGIFILILLVSFALATVISLWTNSKNYIGSEIKRVGFGDLTAWISSVPNTEILANDIANLSEIKQVETQNLIYSNYTINKQKSDSEGQLITFIPQENRYKFFKDDFSGYRQDIPTIASGEIYISPSLVSIFDAQIGDEISFSIARQNKNIVFTIKGFYEDPFMGSSMIGMKGFLISDIDNKEISSIIKNAGIDALAREGSMFHIFSEDYSKITVSELNSIINENTDLPKYTEFIHSENAILGFMLILQNAFSGLLIAFVIVLFFVIIVVLSYSISSTIENDYMNMGILKTIGFTSKNLQYIQLIQYLICIISGTFLGLIFAITLSGFVSSITLTTTGILISTQFPLKLYTIFFVANLILFTIFIIVKTRKMSYITPMKAILNETQMVCSNHSKRFQIYAKGLNISLAFRQLITGKHRYINVCIVAIFLVFFASIVTHINTWLGKDGKGMMDAFNPAEHDIGVQIFGNLTLEETESIITSYTDITDNYLLAMPNVTVNGIDYSANVISEPERFHIMQGKTCLKNNEIVLTEFVASDLGVTIGDILPIRGDAGSSEYIISGIYQCANDMGNNIGMNREGYLKIGENNPYIWCHHYFIADSSQKHIIMQTLEETYGGDVHTHENSWPGLIGIISAMNILVKFMYIMLIIFILISTIISSAKILSSEQKNLSIYKAIGFSTQQLRLTFALRFAIVSSIGSLIGTIFAILFADSLILMVMKFAGISNFTSSPNAKTILFPITIVILLFTSFSYFLSVKIKISDVAALIAK